MAVQPGCLDEFEKLTGEMVAAAQTEYGVLAYQRFISDDRRTVYVHERYTNSESAATHLVKFTASYGERYGRLVERKRFVVFGDPSDGLRALLDKYGATYHGHLGHFLIWADTPEVMGRKPNM